MQIFLETVLKEAFLLPVVADDMDAALEKIIVEEPCVIIIDMMMSGQQGSRMYRQLKQHEKFRSIPVIMLSSLAAEAFFQFQGLGNSLPGGGLPRPEGYLLKPLEADELICMVHDLLHNGTPTNKRKA